jgi:glycerol-3-phosphate O-acyltransferase / dihydroxyacetone phosphate acyltransferase
LTSSSSTYKFKILPKIDQTQVFRHVITHLGNGGAVGIFPEGGSHDQTDILPFKAGVAFMALGTAVAHNMPVTIIPCGLKYFKSH